MPVILATQEAKIRRITVQSQPGKVVWKTLSQQYSTRKSAGGVAQVVEHLPSKCEALSSNPILPKKFFEVYIVIKSWMWSLPDITFFSSHVTSSTHTTGSSCTCS
jgi:hypothetical protein